MLISRKRCKIYTYNGRLIGNSIWSIKWSNDSNGSDLHRLQAFSNAIRRTFVQHSTRLTVCSHGSCALAELLVEFYTARNIFGTAKATDFKFYQGLATRSNNFQMTKCPLSGRGQGHESNSRISHPLKYLWNGWSVLANFVVKFCVLAGYIKC